MTRVVIVLDEGGKFQAVYADSESDVVVLQRGRGDDNNKIDAAEQEMEEVVQ